AAIARTTTQPNINAQEYSELPVLLPKSPEQHAIVEYVRSLGSAVAAAKKTLEAARRLKTALMQQLFTRGLPGRHSRFQQTKIGEIPADWNITPIRLLGSVITGSTPPTEKPEYYDSSDCMFVTPGDIGEERLISSNER